MKLITALETGKLTKPKTVGEAIAQIDTLVGTLSKSDCFDKELAELHKEVFDLYAKTNFTKDSLIENVLMYLGYTGDIIDPEPYELNL